jgi:hypothetical protein
LLGLKRYDLIIVLGYVVLEVLYLDILIRYISVKLGDISYDEYILYICFQFSY